MLWTKELLKSMISDVSCYICHMFANNFAGKPSLASTALTAPVCKYSLYTPRTNDDHMALEVGMDLTARIVTMAPPISSWSV